MLINVLRHLLYLPGVIFLGQDIPFLTLTRSNFYMFYIRTNSNIVLRSTVNFYLYDDEALFSLVQRNTTLYKTYKHACSIPLFKFLIFES